MRIASIATRFPSLKVTNSDVLFRLAEFNPDVPPKQLSDHQRVLQHMMDKSGCSTRYFRDPSRNERAISHIIAAACDAFSQALLAPAQIDLLIYCGVGRGFLEPAMSSFICQALGMSCECFDVLDACMSWVRALAIADSLFYSNTGGSGGVIENSYCYYSPSRMRITRRQSTPVRQPRR